jgi:hypothetical protein
MSERAVSVGEGWTWVIGSTKWHYFRDKQSLCRKWWLMFASADKEYEQGLDNSPDNCKTCVRLREKELEES